MADCETTMEAGVASPCNRVCAVHPRLKLCVGCGRSLDEIAGWMAFGADERAQNHGSVAVAARFDARRRRAAADGVKGPTPCAMFCSGWC